MTCDMCGKLCAELSAITGLPRGWRLVFLSVVCDVCLEETPDLEELLGG